MSAECPCAFAEATLALGHEPIDAAFRPHQGGRHGRVRRSGQGLGQGRLFALGRDKGEVIAVGPGKLAEDGKHLKMHVEKGDLVLFNKYAGTEIKVDDEDFLVMREDDILAVIEA